MKDYPIIKLENVWRIYKIGDIQVPALRGISLAILRGEFISVIGPSGSGKSTFLHMIGCLDLPTKGRIFLDGKDISLLSGNDLAAIRGREIGFVFQGFNLFLNLTALENVILPMTFLGVEKVKRRRRARELLEKVGLGNRMLHRPSELSGGEQQRVALARAMVNEPEIIVADEPTGNLDSVTGEKIMKLFKELNQDQGKTIVVVTHDPSIAEYSRKNVHIKDGRIIKESNQS